MTNDTNSDGRPVLVGYDGSKGAEHALVTTIRLFRKAPITIATIAGHGLPLVGRDEREAAQEMIEHGTDVARQHGVEVEGVSRTAVSASRGLLAAADELDARAVVVGFRGHSTARSMLLGSCSYGAVHRAQRPTLVVPERSYELPEAEQLGAALIGIDAHDETPETLAQAMELVACPHFVVMHVAEGRLAASRLTDAKGRRLSYSEIREQVATLNISAQEEAAARAVRVAEWLARESGCQTSGEGAVSPGAPWQGLVERSDRGDTELVIVGSRGLGALDRTTLGSCSNAVIHHSRKPILVVP